MTNPNKRLIFMNEQLKPIVLEGEKICNRCGELKNLGDFRKHSRTNDGRYTICRQCVRLTNRKSSLKINYGLTLEEYDEILEKQEGRCAICNKYSKLSVDHDHNTNIVRGLLCIKCNSLIGLAGENINILSSAINYINKNLNND